VGTRARSATLTLDAHLRSQTSLFLLGLAALGCAAPQTSSSSTPVIAQPVSQREPNAAPTDADAGATGGAAAPRAILPFGEPVSVDRLFVADGQCPRFSTENQQWRTIARAFAAVDDDSKLSTWTIRGLLDQAVAATKTLATKQLLVGVEAEALLAHLVSLRAAYTPPPPEPKNLRGPTCYAPRPPPDSVLENGRRLQERVTLLQRLAVAQTLHPATLCRIIAPIRSDIVAAEQIRNLAYGSCRGTTLETHDRQWCDSPQLKSTIDALNRSIELLRELRGRLDELARQAQTTHEPTNH
jgi:hypothetical protein